MNLVFILPDGLHDDPYVIWTAHQNNAYAVTNDKFEKEKTELNYQIPDQEALVSLKDWMAFYCPTYKWNVKIVRHARSDHFGFFLQ